VNTVHIDNSQQNYNGDLTFLKKQYFPFAVNNTINQHPSNLDIPVIENPMERGEYTDFQQ